MPTAAPSASDRRPDSHASPRGHLQHHYHSTAAEARGDQAADCRQKRQAGHRIEGRQRGARRGRQQGQGREGDDENSPQGKKRMLIRIGPNQIMNGAAAFFCRACVPINDLLVTESLCIWRSHDHDQALSIDRAHVLLLSLACIWDATYIISRSIRIHLF